MVQLTDIQIRDPFVLPCPEEHCYYLYGTTDKNCWAPVGEGFNAYRSTDLKDWEGPIQVFSRSPEFWGTCNFWAPEVYRYRESYYMFASFKAEGQMRGTQVLKASHPAGKFAPIGEWPVTPRNWSCLDGTLHVDQDNRPWMVFCHEWEQIRDGAMALIPLKEDLSEADGEAQHLFRASDAPWCCGPPGHPDARVTDGPWVHRTAEGRLLMLWSTFGPEGYSLGYALSDNGKIDGNWSQHPEPLFARDGGHAMIFRRFDGRLVLSLHRPNKTPDERPLFSFIRETSEGLLELDDYEDYS